MMLLSIFVCAIRTQAADLMVHNLAMRPGSMETLVVAGSVSDEDTYGVLIRAELIPQAGNTGTLAFTREPPNDISHVGDPWPGAGVFTGYDTGVTGTASLNGSVDDDGAYVPAPVTYSGVLTGFPVIASAGASGTWTATLDTAAGQSFWEELDTRLISGSIQVIPETCNLDSECDDSIVCTDDRCEGAPDGTCVNTPDHDLCADDGVYCNGEELCDQILGCISAGEPCPDCDEGGDPPCPCETPDVRGVGPRYLAIRPKPLESSVPVKLRVTSPDWPCLSRYVGSLRCAGTGDVCRDIADCNNCTETQLPCLTDVDCDFGLCDNGQHCSVMAQDCLDLTACMSLEVCNVSGDSCESAPLDTIDINDDGLPDGTLGVLVADPDLAGEYTPSEWTGNVGGRCSRSAAPCTFDSDCPRGKCDSPNAAVCNAFDANSCLGGSACLLDETCEQGAVFVYGVGMRPSGFDLVEQIIRPTEYEVYAECAVLPTPATTTMWRWGDTNNDTVLNVADLHLVILAIQGFYDFSTLLNDDLAGTSACTPNQILGVTDVLMAKRAFEGEAFADIDCASPCD